MHVFQMKIVAESCVLVGVQGAGLQWAIFMPPVQSSVIEIAWPQLRWSYFYKFLKTDYGLQWLPLAVEPTNVCEQFF